MRRTITSIITLSCLFISVEPVQAQGFSDVAADHPAVVAISDLKNRGILSGYSDGTFKPEKKVARSEAVKMLITPLLKYGVPNHTSSPYSDVPKGVWYLPYIEEARAKGVIDGPPQKTVFQGERTVLKAEFIKMLLKAHDVDMGIADAVEGPVAVDVANSSEWYFRFMAYGISSSMLETNTKWTLTPGQELTRADAAVLLNAFLEYREGRRTQLLLSRAEKQMISVLNALAAYQSQEALLASSVPLK